ncbi:MAG: hypothetical protein N3E51_00690 [Candidatus Micrarchaeota archaeon]|nr:hypothetical protein [Candidatus Micrarchaeota archaeon]
MTAVTKSIFKQRASNNIYLRHHHLLMRVCASAPSKAILFGEHYAVYGAPALALAIEPRNRVLFSETNGGAIVLRSSLGRGKISPEGYDGCEKLMPYAAVASALFPHGDFPPCLAEFRPAWKTKGAGTSASLCAAFAAGLLRLARKKRSKSEFLDAVLAGDNVAHGGRASGMDATVVSLGGAVFFRKSFSPPSFAYEMAKFALPRGTVLLLIDTFRGQKSETAKMVERFSESFGIACLPKNAPPEKRKSVVDEFEGIWQGVRQYLGTGDARLLGMLMNKNHELLKKRKVSSRGIEEAVCCALSAGALGAKLTGAGGEGGAVLALVEKKDARRISHAIKKETSFESRVVVLSARGACPR